MGKYLSRKLILAVVPILTIILNSKLHLDLSMPDIASIAAIAVGYIFGEAYVDSKGVVKCVEYTVDSTDAVSGQAPIGHN